MSNKAIIYNRVSTTEQNPELQIKECEELIKKLGLKDYEILEEKKSAWKDDEKREVFNSLKKQILNSEIKILVVWDLDRIYRNRKKLVGFFELCKAYRCKVYSFRQKFLEDINKAPEPWNEMLFNQLIFILGWIAEEESSKKSDRVRSAIRKKQGRTISYKGNKWGRKSIITNRLKKEIKELRGKGLTLRQIQKQVYYYDKNHNKKNPSLAIVHKLLSK